MTEEKTNKSLQFRDLVYRDYTGIKNVHKKPNENAHKGYGWYYLIRINKKRYGLSSKSLKSLKYKVLKHNLPWIVEEEERARESFINDVEANRKDPDFTGFWRVTRVKAPFNQYYGCWLYQFKKADEDFRVYDEDLKELREKVKAKNYPWLILDEKTAKKTIIENKNYLNVYNSGIEKVLKVEDKWTPLGFTWIYHYWEDDERKTFRNMNLIVLERKVKRKGLSWKIYDEKAAEKSYEENEEGLKMHHQKTTSGIYLVAKHKNEECKQGFDWAYKYYDGEKSNYITSINLYDLEEKVKSRNLPWIVIDDELAKENYRLYEK